MGSRKFGAPAPSTVEKEKGTEKGKEKTIQMAQVPDNDDEDTSKARPARAITPVQAPPTQDTETQQGILAKAPQGPMGACYGCGRRGHSTQECFKKMERERGEKGIMQKRPFDEEQERTPRRGLGLPKGQGPREGSPQRHGAKRGSTGKAGKEWTPGHQGGSSSHGKTERNTDQGD